MGFFGSIRLFYECFKLSGGSGLIACFRFLTGSLQLSETVSKSSDFSDGDFYV